jgi:hypothetical protein
VHILRIFILGRAENDVWREPCLFPPCIYDYSFPAKLTSISIPLLACPINRHQNTSLSLAHQNNILHYLVNMQDLLDESHANKRHKRRFTGFCQLWIAFAFGCISTYMVFASLGTQPKLPSFKYRMGPTPEYVAIYTGEELQSSSRNRLSGRYWQIADEKTESRVFNGSPSCESEFKGPPSPQVDATWSQYWKGTKCDTIENERTDALSSLVILGHTRRNRQNKRRSCRRVCGRGAYEQ